MGADSASMTAFFSFLSLPLSVRLTRLKKALTGLKDALFLPNTSCYENMAWAGSEGNQNSPVSLRGASLKVEEEKRETGIRTGIRDPEDGRRPVCLMSQLMLTRIGYYSPMPVPTGLGGVIGTRK